MQSFPINRRKDRISARFGLFFQAAIILIAIPAMVRAAEEQAVVGIELNGENKGELVVYIKDAKDFLITADDLTAIGLRNPQGQSAIKDNKPYILLSSMPKVSFTFDESRLVLQIKADPALLGKTEVDFSGGKRNNLVFPHDNSLIFNYGIHQGISQDQGFSSFTASQEVGTRVGDYLFTSNSILNRSENQFSATRLMTSVTQDNRNSMTKTIFGDVYASSGNLGSMLLLGGISYGKTYSMEPAFQKRPGLDYTGFLELPSQVDVYVDGLQIKSEKLSPGQFSLNNISADGGLHGLEVRIRDALGREQTLSFPFYSSNTLLRKGLHDYSYNVGILRKNYGLDSNRYSGLAFSAYHWYGLTSHSTVGFRAEGGGGLFNGGPQLIASLLRYGVMDAGFSFDAGNNTKRGMAASLSHTYLRNNISVRFHGMAYSRNYRTLSDASNVNRSEPPRFLFEAGMGYGLKKLGSLSLNLSGAHKYSGPNRDLYSLSYSRALRKRASLSITYQHVRDDKTSNQIFAILSLSLRKDVAVSTSFQRQNNSGAEFIQIQKNPPAGEGYSYRAHIQRSDSLGQSTTVVDPYFQYNGHYGMYTAEYRNNIGEGQSNSGSFEFSASGSIVYASGTWGFARPVDDSFAIIETNHLKNIRAYFNNHEIGATSGAGKIIIPIVNSYVDNILAINDKDIPVNYTLKDVSRRIIPQWKSGTRVRFEATKIQAFSGKLFIKADNKEQPVEFAEISYILNKNAQKFITGRDGEFYLENIPPGQYQANFKFKNLSYSFVLKIPASDEMFVDIGSVTIENDP